MNSSSSKREKWSWYWNRLRAMSPREMTLRALVKWRNYQDRNGFPQNLKLALPDAANRYLRLPDPEEAPEALKVALRLEAEEILAGRWTAFGRTPIEVQLPPNWSRDDWAGVDQPTHELAFQLNHRNLSHGADIKWIWEWSRWTPIVRLAQAAYVNGDSKQAQQALSWLEDWEKNNPPYRGWNWTSALESGMRLIQWRWLDGLLRQTWMRDKELDPSAQYDFFNRIQTLRESILPAHIWSTWRRRSFGSSANNHLLGELTGVLMALICYPDLEGLGIRLDQVQALWEKEIVNQFAEDGGNREQALNYHLYSWEFAWQGWWALKRSGHDCSKDVDSVLARGAVFHREMIEVDPSKKWGSLTWPYGDSDDALATPTLIHENRAAEEWKSWMEGRDSNEPASSLKTEEAASDYQGSALDFWYGSFPREWRRSVGATYEVQGGWRVFKESGYAVYRDADWFLRWDISPLGYLSMAAHGHADALHLSVWYRGRAFIIDPGTGAYYGDAELRSYLASWTVHNTPTTPMIQTPQRLGPFLWARHHAAPACSPFLDQQGEVVGLRCQVDLEEGPLVRTIHALREGEAAGSRILGWRVEDDWSGIKATVNQSNSATSVPDDQNLNQQNLRNIYSHWQTPADAMIDVADSNHAEALGMDPLKFKIQRGHSTLVFEATEGWELSWQSSERNGDASAAALESNALATSEVDQKLAGSISPAFRRVERAPFIRLAAPLQSGRGSIELMAGAPRGDNTPN